MYYTQPDIFYELEGKFYVNHVLKGDRFIGEGRELKVGRGGYILSGYGGVEEEVLVGEELGELSARSGLCGTSRRVRYDVAKRKRRRRDELITKRK